MSQTVTLLSGYKIDRTEVGDILLRLNSLSEECNKGGNIYEAKNSVLGTAWLKTYGLVEPVQDGDIEFLKKSGLLEADGSMTKNTVDVAILALNFDGTIQRADQILRP